MVVTLVARDRTALTTLACRIYKNKNRKIKKPVEVLKKIGKIKKPVEVFKKNRKNKKPIGNGQLDRQESESAKKKFNRSIFSIFSEFLKILNGIKLACRRSRMKRNFKMPIQNNKKY